MKSKPKLPVCVKCKHSYRGDCHPATLFCGHLRVTGYDIITGSSEVRVLCRTARQDGDRCGLGGKLYEPSRAGFYMAAFLILAAGVVIAGLADAILKSL